MSKESEALKIHILEKEYLVACPEEEVEALKASAKYLGDKMAEIRGSGKVVGIDRIAVMAGLNLANEVIGSGGGSGGEGDSYGARIRQLNKKIDGALKKLKKLN